MTPSELARRVELAEHIALKAGALAHDYFRRRDSLVIETKRHLTDLVSQADREVEALIREALTEAFPADAQLGEELGLSPGAAGGQETGLTWVIDPIDGTAPYLNGLPGWCVSIGACDAAGPAIGILYAPVLGEMFVASRGRPTTLNGVPVRVADHLELRTGMVGVGANDRVPAERVGRMLGDLTAAGCNWVRYGSGALMLAWVAAGRLVAYAEPRMSAWDCMAAYCLINEAGGRVLDFPAGQAMLSAAPVLGSTRGSHGELLALTRLDDTAWWSF